MRSLSCVQAVARRAARPMRRRCASCSSILPCCCSCPRWSGRGAAAAARRDARSTATRVALDPRDPRARRVGALTLLGGVQLPSRDAGVRRLLARRDARRARFTLLSDGGNCAAVRDGRRLARRATSRSETCPRARAPAGRSATATANRWRSIRRRATPGSGSRTPTRSGATPPDFARAPRRASRRAAMARLARSNGGAEAMVRLRDGRFVVICEKRGRQARDGRREAAADRRRAIFDGRSGAAPVARSPIVPPAGYDPSRRDRAAGRRPAGARPRASAAVPLHRRARAGRRARDLRPGAMVRGATDRDARRAADPRQFRRRGGRRARAADDRSGWCRTTTTCGAAAHAAAEVPAGR